MNFLYFVFYTTVFCSVCLKNVFGKRREKLRGRGSLRPSDKTRGITLNLDYNTNTDDKRLSNIGNINKLLIVFDNECTNDINEIEQILSSIESIYPCLTEDLINYNSVIYEMTDTNGNTEYHAYLQITDEFNDNSINSCIDNTEIYYQDYCIEYIFYEPLFEEFMSGSSSSTTSSSSYSSSFMSDMEYINNIDANDLWYLDVFDGIKDNKFCYIKPLENIDPNVDIYILDSEIMSTHIEFEGVNIVNLDESRTNSGPEAYLHGTAVASVAVGKTVGIARGLRSSITVYQYPIFYKKGDSQNMQHIEDAFKAVINKLQSTNRRGVINMSNGQFNFYREERFPDKSEQWFEDFYTNYGNRIIDAGGIIVAAAGNSKNEDGLDSCNIFPAKLNNYITVGNAKYKRRYWTSNWGPCVDVFLPGSVIKIATNKAIDDYVDDDGTSLSAPYLTGIIAQMLAINNDLTFEQIKEIITKPQNNVMLTNCPTCNLLQFKSCKDFYYQSWRPGYKYTGVCDLNEQFTWYEANEYCEIEYGTTLASVHSDQDNELFKEARESSSYGSWTGLRSINNNFEWIDGSIYDYQLQWHINNPDYPSNENCIQMFSSEWGLDTYGDVKCSTHERKCFVCWEKETS